MRQNKDRLEFSTCGTTLIRGMLRALCRMPTHPSPLTQAIRCAILSEDFNTPSTVHLPTSISARLSAPRTLCQRFYRLDLRLNGFVALCTFVARIAPPAGGVNKNFQSNVKNGKKGEKCNTIYNHSPSCQRMDPVIPGVSTGRHKQKTKAVRLLSGLIAFTF